MAQFNKKKLGEMISYSRPTPNEYQDEFGHTIMAAPNRIRLEYNDQGYLMGIKFGDGDTMRIPRLTNKQWMGNGGGTLFVIGSAPEGVTWFKCGNIEIEGVNALKLHIFELTPSEVQTLDKDMLIFPNADTVTGQSYFLMAKYYNDNITIPADERAMMEEFNQFMNQPWS